MFTTLKAEHSRPRIRATMAVILLTTFSGCGIENLPNPFERGQDAAAGASAADNAVAGTRDIEAPAVFETTEPGLWDGRPSLGGIWVAHPDVTDPERVVIRNRATGQSVTGALFKRERESPGPKLQVSSEAAAELGMLAGQPAELNVVALRRTEGQKAGAGGMEAPSGEAAPRTSGDPVDGGPADQDGSFGPSPGAPGPRTPATPPPLGRPGLEAGANGADQAARDTTQSRRAASLSPIMRERMSKAGERAALPEMAGAAG